MCADILHVGHFASLFVVLLRATHMQHLLLQRNSIQYNHFVSVHHLVLEGNILVKLQG